MEFHYIRQRPHSRGWNRGVDIYRVISGVGIEGFHSFQGVGSTEK